MPHSTLFVMYLKHEPKKTFKIVAIELKRKQGPVFKYISITISWFINSAATYNLVLVYKLFFI